VLKVDSHQHFWNVNEVVYSWLVPEYGPIFRTCEPKELEPQLKTAGIDKTILVQSANSYEDTAYMLKISDTFDWVGAVTGWVNLEDPDETNARIEMYRKHPKFRAVRDLIHTARDPDWLIEPVVAESLKILAVHDIIFEVAAVFPNHLKHVPTLAERVPSLRIVIDHLAKPPIRDKNQMSPWGVQLKAAAESKNVYAKVSGLNSGQDNWVAADLKPSIDLAMETFSADRLMSGSDWPLCLLVGDYQKVWTETQVALQGCSQSQIDAILGGTAQKLYRIT
jgi:L-fuconolactonase